MTFLITNNLDNHYGIFFQSTKEVGVSLFHCMVSNNSRNFICAYYVWGSSEHPYVLKMYKNDGMAIDI